MRVLAVVLVIATAACEGQPHAVQPNAAHQSAVRTPPPARGGHVANAEHTIIELRPRFKACYDAGLARDRTMTGKLFVCAKITGDGEVASAEKCGGSGLSPEVETCILDHVRAARFDGPCGSGATLQIPISFIVRQ